MAETFLETITEPVCFCTARIFVFWIRSSPDFCVVWLHLTFHNTVVGLLIFSEVTVHPTLLKFSLISSQTVVASHFETKALFMGKILQVTELK